MRYPTYSDPLQADSVWRVVSEKLLHETGSATVKLTRVSYLGKIRSYLLNVVIPSLPKNNSLLNTVIIYTWL